MKKCCPYLVLGCVLRTAGSSFIWNYADPLTWWTWISDVPVLYQPEYRKLDRCSASWLKPYMRYIIPFKSGCFCSRDDSEPLAITESRKPARCSNRVVQNLYPVTGIYNPGQWRPFWLKRMGNRCSTKLSSGKKSRKHPDIHPING